MKDSSHSFVRKIIYVVIMGALLIPLNMLARPATRKKETDGTTTVANPGGRLAKLRDEFRLSQSSISEIDPASQAMKLASLGLRGVAVNVLWMQALDHKKNEDYDKLAQTLQMLTKMQPNFVKVWEYQGHNLAFNVSMEFDDYEYRYEWVKKGLNFLKSGIPYNKTDHRMTDNMGFFTGTKFGKSDEKIPFRRMFRKDGPFHQDNADQIDPESYNTNAYGPDSYGLAWQWYDKSRNIKDAFGRYRSDLMFLMFRPAQKRQQAQILAKEFRTDEVIQEIWARAGEEWQDYGDTEMQAGSSVSFTLEKLSQYEKRLAKLRQELDELTPGSRQKENQRRWERLGLNPDLSYLIDTPLDEVDDEQRGQIEAFFNYLNQPDQDYDLTIALSAPEGSGIKARRIANDIVDVLNQIAARSKEGSVVNYTFWKSRCTAESTDALVRARQASHDALEMQRRSIYEDEHTLDYRTGEKVLVRKGADSLYRESFEQWNEVLEEFPELVDSPVVDEMFLEAAEYFKLTEYSNRKWKDFPLQKVVDTLAARGKSPGLPTSSELRAMEQDAADAAEQDEEDSDDQEDSDDEEDSDQEDSDDKDSDDKDSDEEDSDEEDSDEEDSDEEDSDEEDSEEDS